MSEKKTTRVKLWHCRNCGHEEPVTENDLAELNPSVSSSGAIKIGCPNCGAYTVSKPFDRTFRGGEFLVVKPHLRRKVGSRSGQVNYRKPNVCI